MELIRSMVQKRFLTLVAAFELHHYNDFLGQPCYVCVMVILGASGLSVEACMFTSACLEVHTSHNPSQHSRCLGGVLVSLLGQVLSLVRTLMLESRGMYSGSVDLGKTKCVEMCFMASFVTSALKVLTPRAQLSATPFLSHGTNEEGDEGNEGQQGREVHEQERHRKVHC